jgi:lysine 2,3-aminomutase
MPVACEKESIVMTKTMARSYRDISLFHDVTDEEWNDYRWQLRNRLRSTDDFAHVLNLDDQQRADLDACMGRFRVSVTPYYASLMDPDDPLCPIRMQGVPSPAELVIHREDLKDAVSEDVDSPTPRITHRYPDRVLFVVTEMCSMYCRHCTRRRLVGKTEEMVRRTEIDNAIRYIERSPEVRDVLLSGGDPLVLSDNHLEEILERVHAIPHVEIIRLGTRAPVVFPQRITPELVAMLKKYQPLYINTHFNHPKEFTPESMHACEILADGGFPLGNQTVLLRGVNDCAFVMKKLVHKLVANRVKPYYYYQCDLAEGTAHFRTSVAKGIEIYESLRGHTTGFAVPTYIIDAIGGGGKMPVFPNYIISQAPGQILLRNYEGIISKYTEPKDYVDRECQCEDCLAERQRRGVAGLFDGGNPTIQDVWQARLQKVVDRKNRMADVFGTVQP